jgi:hypothetical protein
VSVNPHSPTRASSPPSGSSARKSIPPLSSPDLHRDNGREARARVCALQVVSSSSCCTACRPSSLAVALCSSQRTPKGDARLLCSSTTEVNRAFTEQEVSVAGLRRCVTMRTQGTPPAAATSAGASIRPCWATAVVPARGLPSSRPSRSPSWSSRQTPTRSARVEVSYFTLRLL